MKFININTKTKNKPNLKTVKAASFIEMGEDEIANLIEEIKNSRLFKLLKAYGAIKTNGFKKYNISNNSVENLPSVGNEDSDISYLFENEETLNLIKKMGAEKFKKYFLDGGFGEAEIEKQLKISKQDIIKIKDIVSKVFVKEEFSKTNAKKTDFRPNYCVAEIKIEGGKILPCFYNKNIWKDGFEIDKQKLKEYIKISGDKEDEIKEIIEKISLIEYKKSSLVSLIEYLIKEQKKFLIFENYDFLNVLTQKKAAKNIGVCESVLNRLISNRSLKLNSGIIIPIKNLFPSSKKINKNRFKKIFSENKNLTDNELSDLFNKKYGLKLSRRTINQYKNEIKEL